MKKFLYFVWSDLTVGALYEEFRTQEAALNYVANLWKQGACTVAIRREVRK